MQYPDEGMYIKRSAIIVPTSTNSPLAGRNGIIDSARDMKHPRAACLEAAEEKVEDIDQVDDMYKVALTACALLTARASSFFNGRNVRTMSVVMRDRHVYRLRLAACLASTHVTKREIQLKE